MSKFKVNYIRVLSWWEHNLPSNTECSICRENLNLNSLYSIQENSIIVEGICSHCFHFECIQPWVQENKHCPLCMKEWVYKKKPKNF